MLPGWTARQTDNGLKGAGVPPGWTARQTDNGLKGAGVPPGWTARQTDNGLEGAGMPPGWTARQTMVLKAPECLPAGQTDRQTMGLRGAGMPPGRTRFLRTARRCAAPSGGCDRQELQWSASSVACYEHLASSSFSWMRTGTGAAAGCASALQPWQPRPACGCGAAR
jgi:hypothetical protein